MGLEERERGEKTKLNIVLQNRTDGKSIRKPTPPAVYTELNYGRGEFAIREGLKYKKGLQCRGFSSSRRQTHLRTHPHIQILFSSLARVEERGARTNHHSSPSRRRSISMYPSKDSVRYRTPARGRRYGTVRYGYVPSWAEKTETPVYVHIYV
jgi:hypothetical protein